MSSGATIVIDSKQGIVAKMGSGAVGKRIAEQAAWLQRYAHPLVMPVLDTFGTAYTMPLAHGIGSIALSDCLQWCHRAAEDAVWCRPAERADHIGSRFVTKLVSFMVQYPTEVRLVREFAGQHVDFNALVPCATHGDLTIENAMSLNGVVVICDPVPVPRYSLAIGEYCMPETKSVDLGKLLQSAMGWEIYKHLDAAFGGGSYTPFFGPVDLVRSFCTDDNEWRATIAMCGLHIIRLLPYVNGTLGETMKGVLRDVLSLRV